MLDALPPLATHRHLTAVLFPIVNYVLVLGIWACSLLPLDGMGMEWATKIIIISICILIIKCGHRHRLSILCSNPIHNHHPRRHHLNTNVLILCLLIPLNILILILILIPFTLNHPENQIVRQFQNLIHVL